MTTPTEHILLLDETEAFYETVVRDANTLGISDLGEDDDYDITRIINTFMHDAHKANSLLSITIEYLMASPLSLPSLL